MATDVLPVRLKGETVKSYQAFIDYCQMGAARSLADLHQTYTEGTPEKAPTRQLRTIKGWSSRWHWQERVAEYSQNVNAEREKRLEQARIDIERAETRDHDRMLAEWDRRWALLEEAPSAVDYSDLYSLVKLRREVDDFGRRAVGLPDKVTENTVKGTGEKDAIVFAVTGIDLENDI